MGTGSTVIRKRTGDTPFFNRLAPYDHLAQRRPASLCREKALVAEIARLLLRLPRQTSLKADGGGLAVAEAERMGVIRKIRSGTDKSVLQKTSLAGEGLLEASGR